jgi:4-hydroxy-4-methyl-2-oxoglutarate aldolase
VAKTSGVRAIVTDGLARDSTGIAGLGIPVFASGMSPNSAGRSGPGTIACRSQCPACVSSRRYRRRRSRRVVVRPRCALDAVYTRLAAVRDAEASYPTGPNGEVQVPEFVRALLSSEHVRYLD